MLIIKKPCFIWKTGILWLETVITTTVLPSTPPCYAFQCILARIQTCLTLFPQGRHYNWTSFALNSKKRSLLVWNVPSPLPSLTFKKAVDHTCFCFTWMRESHWREWHRMCYLLKSRGAAFLWQHSTRCYSHFAVFFQYQLFSETVRALYKGPTEVETWKGVRRRGQAQVSNSFSLSFELLRLIVSTGIWGYFCAVHYLCLEFIIHKGRFNLQNRQSGTCS